MNTSYFAKYKKSNGISIAIKCPDWFKGESYTPLFPQWNFLSQYFKDKNEEKYIIAYNKYVLSKLNPEEVYNDLKGKTLLCWEKYNDPKFFCHRRLVAKFIEDNLGIEVPEV